MSDLHSFVVVLHFGAPGPLLTCGAYIAPDQASAAAIAMANIKDQNETGPLLSCLVVEESAENLRARLHVIEGKKPGDVVSLVRNEPGAGIFGQRAGEILRTAPHGATTGADLSWARDPGKEIYTDPTWPHPPVA